MDSGKTKVQSTVCANCGGQLEIDMSKESIECPYCGTNYTVSDLLDESDAVRIEKIKSRTQKDVEIERLNHEKERLNHEKEMAQKIENKENKAAFKKSKFSKVLIIFAVISLLSCAVSFSDGNILTGIVALIQTGLFAGAWLMGMQIINEPKKGVRAIAAIVAFALIIPYMGLQDVDFSSNSRKVEKISWKNIKLSEQLPEPKSNKGEIITNSDESLSLYIHNTSQEDYNEYEKKCKEKGFNVEAESSEGFFDAFNEKGYKLSLSYDEDEKECNIYLNAPMEMKENQWPQTGLGSILPIPKSNVGKVSMDDSDSFIYYAGNTTIDDLKQYADACFNAGFTNDYSKSDEYFTGINAEGYDVSISYHGNSIMEIRLDTPEEKETEETEETEETNEKKTTVQDSSSASANGVSAEFKTAMDSYEKFFDEYIAFLNKYSKADGTDATLLADYAKYMSRYTDTMQKFEALQNDDMSTEEAAYYLEVQGRITKKLLEVAQ